MKNQIVCNGVRNIIAVVIGLFIYLIADTIISIVAGVLLKKITQIHPDTIYFQIVLKFIVAASNARLITFVVNHIAVRNNKGYNIPEYIIGIAIIVSVISMSVMSWNNKNFDTVSIIFCVFNLLLSIILFFDAKEELL